MVTEQPDFGGKSTGYSAATAPELEDLRAYEQGQRKRTLSFIIWVVLIAAVILGTFDIQFNTLPSIYALFGLAALCIPTLILNQRGNYYLAAIGLSVIALIVITINLYNGDGLRDPGLMTYPIFVMVGTLLFGRRAALYFGIAAAASLALITAAQVLGWVHPTIGPVKLNILIPVVTMLAASAGIVWATVRNMDQHLERARQSEAELRRNYDLTLEAWAKVMEYRDRETEGHSRRLVALTARLGRALAMSDTEILQLQRGALLHDIGKLAIPDEILLKPSGLDDKELKVMHKHPVFARQMLEGIPFLRPSLAVAYSHHEHWDGHGYPDGLKGEEIPLAARAFAVMDTWDALNSDRVYRPAWPRDKIIEYIKDNAGSRFDPRVVQVFLKIIE